MSKNRQCNPPCDGKTPDDDRGRRLLVDTIAFARLLGRLEAPPAPNQRLIRTMRSVPPWKP